MDRISSRSERPAPPRDPRAALARHRRDDSLNRVSRLTTRVAVGALALVGALGVYVSQALPGHAGTPSSTAGTGTTPATPSTTPATQPSTDPSAQAPSATTPPTVSPPVTAPVQTQAPARVRTGGS